MLAARYRLGEQLWTFPARPGIVAAAHRLGRRGLVGMKSGVAPKTIQVWFTDAGRAAALSDSYEPPVERSDLPVGQQSNLGPFFNESAEEINVSIRKLVAGLDTLGIRPYADNARSWSWVLFCLDGIDELQREVARVRAQTAEEIADRIMNLRDAWLRDPPVLIVGAEARSDAAGIALHDAASLARQHAGKPAESVVAAPDRVWWVHRCTPNYACFHGPTAADGERPPRCAGCGEAANNWFKATRVDRLPEE